MFGLDDNKKIGIGLLITGLICFIAGVILLFDRALILIGNLCFILGLYFLVGLMGTVGFFLKKGKLKGTGFFLGGFLVICIFRFTFIGFAMQIYGIFVLFKSFIPFLYESACSLPIVGKYLRNFSFLKKMIEKLSKRKPPV